MALQRPTRWNALVHLAAQTIDDSLIAVGAAIAQAKISGLVAALAAKAGIGDDNVFLGNNTFNNSLVVPAATANNHAVNLGQLNAATVGVNTAIHAPAGSIVLARAIPSAEFTEGEIINIAGTPGIWRFSAASLAVDDGVGTLKPDDILVGDPGRLIFFLEQASNVVTLVGDQTIYDVKNFDESPLVPAATLNGQAVNKGQVDSAISAAIGAQPTVRVVRIDAAAIGTTDLPKTGGFPNIPDDDSVQLWVNQGYWRKGANNQFTVTPGGGSLTIFALEEVSDIEFRYIA